MKQRVRNKKYLLARMDFLLTKPDVFGLMTVFWKDDIIGQTMLDGDVYVVFKNTPENRSLLELFRKQSKVKTKNILRETDKVGDIKKLIE